MATKKTKERARPPFILSTKDVPEDDAHGYPNSSERHAHGRAIGKAAGLLRIGLHVERLPAGRRLSYPHAEEDEEEFVYVLEGEVDAWVDGHVYRMRAGDLAAFPCGTGICHTFINDGDRDCLLLVGGEAAKRHSRIYYPLNPERRTDLVWSAWWSSAPSRPFGPHGGKPKPRRASGR